jgi:hypothetical protein
MSIELSTVLSAGALSLSVLTLGAVVALRRTAARWQSRCQALEASLPALHRDLGRLVSISARTHRQVKRMENKCSGVADRVDPVELRAPGSSLDNAIESARRGAEPGRLTQQFGLSRAEAELMARMHRAPSAAGLDRGH